MLDVLRKLIASGPKTSEFWIALVALFIPILDTIVNKILGIMECAPLADGTVTCAPHVSPWTAIGAAVIAGLYAIGRSFVKKSGVTSIISSGAADDEARDLSLARNAARTSYLASEREALKNAPHIPTDGI